jgi:hypothetical protein
MPLTARFGKQIPLLSGAGDACGSFPVDKNRVDERGDRFVRHIGQAEKVGRLHQPREADDFLLSEDGPKLLKSVLHRRVWRGVQHAEGPTVLGLVATQECEQPIAILGNI